MKNEIMKISRLRLGTDGEGIRTLVAFHGCSLSCKYCLNSQCLKDETYRAHISPSELLETVEIDNLYFRSSGGGITFGGGEPLLASEYIKDFCELAADKYPEWNINIETSLNVPWENVKRLIPYVSKWIIDIKSFDADTYKRYTGGSVRTMKENLRLLKESGVAREKIVIRIPKIPRYQECVSDMRKSIEYAARFADVIETFEYRIV